MGENLEKRQRTRQRLTDALVALCEEKPYYDITVWDICRRADVYRSTFYRYYDTKDEMLREIEHDYLEKTRSLTKSLEDFHTDATEEQRAIYRQELAADMAYHRENAALCRFLLSPAGDLYFHQKMVDSISRTVEHNIRKHGLQAGQDPYYLIHYFASGFISTVHEWLIRNDQTPEQMADFLLNMMERMRF